MTWSFLLLFLFSCDSCADKIADATVDDDDDDDHDDDDDDDHDDDDNNLPLINEDDDDQLFAPQLTPQLAPTSSCECHKIQSIVFKVGFMNDDINCDATMIMI